MSRAKTFSEKLREIRDVHGLGRKALSDETGISIRTIEGIEQRGTIPRTDIAQKISMRWPQYSLWLMTDETNEECGQISPSIEEKRRIFKKNIEIIKAEESRVEGGAYESKSDMSISVSAKDELEENIDLALEKGDFKAVIEALKDSAKKRKISIESIASATSLKDKEIEMLFSNEGLDGNNFSGIIFLKVLWFLRFRMAF